MTNIRIPHTTREPKRAINHTTRGTQPGTGELKCRMVPQSRDLHVGGGGLHAAEWQEEPGKPLSLIIGDSTQSLYPDPQHLGFTTSCPDTWVPSQRRQRAVARSNTPVVISANRPL